MRQYEITELIYTGSAELEDLVDIDLEGEFSSDSESISVKGFYEGNGQYKVHFLPLHAGLYHYKVTGLFTDEGDLEVDPANSACPRSRGWLSLQGQRSDI